MTKIAYIDFDGTIVDAKKAMATVYNEKYRKENNPIINHDLITTWDGGIPDELVDLVFSDDYFFEVLEVYDGFEEAMNILKSKGYELVLYTKGVLGNISNKSKWIEERYGDLFSGWIFSGSNNLTMGKAQLDMSVKDGISILIDDHIKNITCSKDSKHAHHMPTFSICAKLAKRKDEEWNRDWVDEDMTLYNWKDLEKLINRLERIYEYSIE